MISATTLVWMIVGVCLIGAALFTAEGIREGKIDVGDPDR